MAKKLAALEALQPDIAVLPETLAPERESMQLRWFPSNASRLGIQVRSFGSYKLKRIKTADLPNCVVPLRVDGPARFNLLAVWTWPAPSYSRAFLNGLEAYAKLIRRSPTVVAGDFNGNPVFDQAKPRIRRWTDGFSQLHEAELVSAYHAFSGLAFGSERHATHHFLRKSERPFHIDFCFVPRSWAQIGLQAQVLHGPDWYALSDHFPLVVDVALEAEGHPASTED